MAKRDLYVSVDVEADGPIPGPYSMLSFGMAACGTFDGQVFTPVDPAESTFYAELAPISDTYDPAALAVSGLDRDHLAVAGRDPAEAMNAATAWLAEVTAAADASAVLVAYPLGFDWMFLYWYWMRLADAGSPFGHSRHLDLKSLYAAKTGAMVTRSTKRQMPAGLLSDRPHTHNALDDAIEQAELFQNLVRWPGHPH
ncbi:exonuclease [Actinomadura sp. KC345]|uniref:3'-5' exonuclease n=1 Tax=Actinomadura sp. KC345 TaxID=2530371 RepID=UPI00104608A1|nr:exonuclease [Actinomadura sp. KC345]TDC45898.1 exonuclease [Actinomadura sp. KC345]